MNEPVPTRPATMPGRGPAIALNGVSLELGGNPILEDVQFKVEPGELHCIIGPNGGGKTSLLRALMGQMPHRGEIAIDWPAGRTTGYVPQTLDFDRTLPITVADFMAVTNQSRPAFLGLKKRHRQAVASALGAVGMADKVKRSLGQLSGGERQRVLFAQALLPPPNLLLLDEPMAGLDRPGLRMMEDRIVALKAEGVTILWVHHDLRQVKRLADTVTCINRTVQFAGPPEDVLSADHLLDVFSYGPAEGTARS